MLNTDSEQSKEPTTADSATSEVIKGMANLMMFRKEHAITCQHPYFNMAMQNFNKALAKLGAETVLK